jgi:hypothetical protein
MPTNASEIITNLINGNVTDAKAGAKRKSFQDLERAAEHECGLNSAKAQAAALFLKGQITFQEYCDTQ